MNDKKKIIIDLTGLMPQSTGVDIYMKQLVLNLSRIDASNSYLICLNFEDRNLCKGKLPENFSCRWFCIRLRLFRLFFQQVILPILSWTWKADVVHSPAFIMPYVKGSAGHVLTIHDLSSFSHPECHNALRRSSSYLAMVRVSMQRADILISPSMATRQAILDYLPDTDPDRIHVTPLGLSDDYRPADTSVVEEMRRRLELPQRYILYVGTLEPRKNLSALVESFRRLVESDAVEEHLVIAGRKGWGFEPVLKQLQAPELKGRVHLTDYVNQEDLPALYSGARLFVYPSLLEGFGLPPLEAMACGTPTISTWTSSLSENLQGGAELVPPDDVEALSEAITRLLNNEDLWAKQRTLGLQLAARYRWEETASRTLTAYQAASTIED